MRTLVLLLAVVLLALPLGGCSVAMALTGEKDPDLSVLTAGASRAEIEAEFGEPAGEIVDGYGRVHATYKYGVGNEPSVVRAIAHGCFDVLTLGIWEIPGTMIETAVDKKDFEVTVIYDPEERVAATTEHTPLRREEEPMAIVSAEE